MSEQTLGEKRVKISFNTTSSEIVDKIKYSTAKLINDCEDLRDAGTPEKQRLISLAQTKYEEAAMYAVKANFTE